MAVFLYTFHIHPSDTLFPSRAHTNTIAKLGHGRAALGAVSPTADAQSFSHFYLVIQGVLAVARTQLDSDGLSRIAKSGNVHNKDNR